MHPISIFAPRRIRKEARHNHRVNFRLIPPEVARQSEAIA